MPPLAAPDPMHQARLEKKRMRYRLYVLSSYYFTSISELLIASNREIEREKARLRAQR